MVWGSKLRRFTTAHIVEVCEGTLAYDGGLLVGALCEFIEIQDQNGICDLINHLQHFQKHIKNGLPKVSTGSW